MEAGSLNRRVLLQKPAPGQDSVGQPIAGWVDLLSGPSDHKVWGNVLFLSGIETLKNKAVESIAKASIRIRYRTDVLVGMRVVYGETNFKITAVLPDADRREHVDLACEVIQ